MAVPPTSPPPDPGKKPAKPAAAGVPPARPSSDEYRFDTASTGVDPLTMPAPSADADATAMTLSGEQTMMTAVTRPVPGVPAAPPNRTAPPARPPNPATAPPPAASDDQPLTLSGAHTILTALATPPAPPAGDGPAHTLSGSHTILTEPAARATRPGTQRHTAPLPSGDDSVHTLSGAHTILTEPARPRPSTERFTASEPAAPHTLSGSHTILTEPAAGAGAGGGQGTVANRTRATEGAQLEEFPTAQDPRATRTGGIDTEAVTRDGQPSSRRYNRTRVNTRLAPDTQILDQKLQLSRPSVLVDMAAATGEQMPAGLAKLVAAQGTGGRYAINRPLAAGGMGAVLHITDGDFQRAAAMKVIHGKYAKDPAALERFLQEAQVTAQLEHPNIVPIHDLGAMADGSLYYTMGLLRGRSLGDVLKLLKSYDKKTKPPEPPKPGSTEAAKPAPARPQEPPTADELAAIARWTVDYKLHTFLKVLDGVGYANERGVVHRDIKPDNVMVGANGEVTVVDWGIAKILGKAEIADELVKSIRDEQSVSATLDGAAMGTPTYMPPEQAAGDKERMDQRSDIYALGATLYELLSHKRYLEGRTAQELVTKCIAGDGIPFEQAMPGAHQDLTAIVRKSMAYNSEQRYQSCAEFAADIRSFMAGAAVSARRRNLIERIGAWYGRNKRAVQAGAAAVVLVAGAVGGTVMWQRAQSRRQADALVMQARDALQAQSANDFSDEKALTVIGETLAKAEGLDPAHPGLRPLRDPLNVHLSKIVEKRAAANRREEAQKRLVDARAKRASIAAAAIGDQALEIETRLLGEAQKLIDTANDLDPQDAAIRAERDQIIAAVGSASKRTAQKAAAALRDLGAAKLAEAEKLPLSDPAVPKLLSAAQLAFKQAADTKEGPADLGALGERHGKLEARAQAEREAASKRADAQKLLKEAQALVTAEKLAEAATKVESAREFDPSDQAIDALRSELQKLLADANKRRNQATANRLRDEGATALAEAEKLPLHDPGVSPPVRTALKRFEDAIKTGETPAGIDALIARAAKLDTDAEAARRLAEKRADAQRLLKEAQALMTTGNLADAATKVESARESDPADKAIDALRSEIQKLRADQIEAELQRTARDAFAVGAKHLAAARTLPAHDPGVEAALRDADVAFAKSVETKRAPAELKTMVQEATVLRQAVKAAQARLADEAALQSGVADAKAKVAAKDLDGARDAVVAALKRMPGDPAAVALRDEILAALAVKRTEEEKQTRLANARSGASQALAKAKDGYADIGQLRAQIAALASETVRLEEALKNASYDKKQPLFAARLKAKATQSEITQRWTDTENQAHRAVTNLTEEPTHPVAVEARQLLAQLYYDRLLEVREQNLLSEVAAYTVLVGRYDLEKRFLKDLGNTGTLAVNGPAGATVAVHRVAPGADTRLVASGDPVARLALPAQPTVLPKGRYQLSAGDVVVSVVLDAGATIDLAWPGALPVIKDPDLALRYVPALGANRKAFLLAQTEVTHGQYLRFVTDKAIWAKVVKSYRSITEGGAKEGTALLYLPRLSPTAPNLLWVKEPEGLEGLERVRLGDLHPDLPVTSISRADAEAFCAWLSERLKAKVRLPTQAEWQFAADGGDRERLYPWGEFFDHALTVSALPNNQAAMPVRNRPTDLGPFGHIGLAGNVREWLADRYGPVGQLDATIAGAAYSDNKPDTFRCSYYENVQGSGVYPPIGFRILVELP